MNDIFITSATLTAVVASTDTARTRVGTARAASDAAMPLDAFGLMCSPLLLPPYLLVKTAADGMLDAASGALERLADRVHEASNRFEEADNSVVDMIQRVGRSAAL